MIERTIIRSLSIIDLWISFYRKIEELSNALVPNFKFKGHKEIIEKTSCS